MSKQCLNKAHPGEITARPRPARVWAEPPGSQQPSPPGASPGQQRGRRSKGMKGSDREAETISTARE